jgi:hypothetical protein
MRQNAAGDVVMTLIAFIELLRYDELDFSCLDNGEIGSKTPLK